MRNVFLLLVFAAALVAGVAALIWFGPVDRAPVASEILITLILIIGVIALIATLGALATLLHQWRIYSRTEALGLPPGSVRAVIALGLVLIFAMVSVYLVTQAADPFQWLFGLTQAQVDSIPGDRLVASYSSLTEGRFDVLLRGDRSEFQDDLSQQLMTLLGTLVTAVVAFYFGTAHPSGGTGGDGTGGLEAVGTGAAAAATAQEEAANAQEDAAMAQDDAAAAQEEAAAAMAQEADAPAAEPGVAEADATAKRRHNQEGDTGNQRPI